MSEQREFRGVWIPADIWMNRDLSLQEKVMLIEIDSLQHPERGCFKSNAKLADFFGLSPSRVSEVISALEKKGWVRVEQIREGKACVERRIFIKKNLSSGYSENTEKGIRNPEEPIRNPEEGYSENTEERGSGFRGSKRGSVENPLSSSDELNDAFERFWDAGLVKQGKTKSKPKFAKLCKDMKLTADQLADKLVADIKARKAAGQYGFDKLHALTYLNGRRWEDEIVANNVHQFPSKPQAKYHNLGASVEGLTPRADGTYSL